MLTENQKEKLLTNNPFLERTIEYWLTNINELGYQLPFCQLLVNKGYTVLHKSKHNPFEQGKDIIAIDQDGIPCAFQLKSGDININKWRNGYMQEVEELISYQIIHPSVDKNIKHKSFLVTNGKLEDTVRLAIDNLKFGRWKDSQFDMILKDELLLDFIKFSNNFLPQKVSDYKSFLDLFFISGKELIDEDKFTKFIYSVLRVDEDGLSKAERKRNIASAVLYTSIVLSNIKNENNYIGNIQGLVLSLSGILLLAEKYSLENVYWENSFALIWEEIIQSGALLQKEIEENGFNEMVTSIWDGEVGIYRKHISISYLFAYKLTQLIEGNESWKDVLTNEFFTKIPNSLTIWSESAIITNIFLFFLLKKASILNDEDSFKPVYSAIESIIKFNGRKALGHGLLSPYYRITDAVKIHCNLLEEPIDESFVRYSFMLKALIEILAKHNKREYLENKWREITYIAYEAFIPGSLWQNYLWRSKDGEMISVFPLQTQSWEKLVESSKKVDLELIPNKIKEIKKFLPFFLMVFPHRFNSDFVKYLDNLLNTCPNTTTPIAQKISTIQPQKSPLNYPAPR